MQRGRVKGQLRMSWATVAANLDFSTSSSSWALSNGLEAFTSGEEAEILNTLQNLYNNSAEARNALEAIAGSDVLHIGKSSIAAGVWASNIVGYNLSKISDIQYFNHTGALVAEKLGLSLIHEIIHVAYPLSDVLDTSESALNAQDVDQRGDTLEKQSIVAGEMGWTDNIQPSYLAQISIGDARLGDLAAGVSYSNGDTIDIVRIGMGDADTLDHSLNTVNLRDLMIGFAGNDVIKAGAGADYAYGGEGNDSIDGGDANDVVFGGDGHDSLVGGAGDDTLTGGSFSTEPTTGSDGTDTLSGGSGNDLLTSGNGFGASILGGDGNDKIVVRSFNATIDSGGGDDLIDARLGEADIFLDGVTLKWGVDTGHDFLVDPFWQAIATFDMTGVSLADLEFVWDKTLMDTWTDDDDGVPRWNHELYSGDAVIRVDADTTLYIGKITIDYVEDTFLNENYEYLQTDVYPEVVLDDVTDNLPALVQNNPGLIVIGSVAAYMNAPDNWI